MKRAVERGLRSASLRSPHCVAPKGVHRKAKAFYRTNFTPPCNNSDTRSTPNWRWQEPSALKAPMPYRHFKVPFSGGEIEAAMTSFLHYHAC